MDNLNTHTKASLYEAFDPPEAKRIADKLVQPGGNTMPFTR
jgi:hypothetical protein